MIAILFPDFTVVFAMRYRAGRPAIAAGILLLAISLGCPGAAPSDAVTATTSSDRAPDSETVTSEPTTRSVASGDAEIDAAESDSSGKSDPSSEFAINEFSGLVAKARRETLNQFVIAQQRGNLDAAAEVLQRWLIEHPSDLEIVCYLASIHAATGRIDSAIELYGSVPPDHPQFGLQSLGVSADLCMAAERYSDAEQRFLQILQRRPGTVMAMRPLAYLYNRQGRRHEATQLTRQLCLAGDVMQEELHGLVARSDAMYTPPGEQPERDGRPYWPIGPSGAARKAFADSRYAEAAQLLEPIFESASVADPDPRDADADADRRGRAAAVALYGRSLAESQNDAALEFWLAFAKRVSNKNPVANQISLTDFPDYWAAIGIHLINQTRYQDAKIALARALLLDPTDIRCQRRMIQVLRTTAESTRQSNFAASAADLSDISGGSSNVGAAATDGDTLLTDEIDNAGNADRNQGDQTDTLTERWIDRYQILFDSIVDNAAIADTGGQSPEPILQLATKLDSLGRRLESTIWRIVAASVAGDQSQIKLLSDRRLQLINSGLSFPSPDEILLGLAVDLDTEVEFFSDEHSNLKTPSESQPSESQPSESLPAAAKFRDVARPTGLDHRYRLDLAGRESAFAIYQQFGGGVAVLDYDADGRPDLYFAQGAAEAPDFESTESDSLFRNQPQPATDQPTTANESMPSAVNVTIPAGLIDSQYSVGVTAGDWNQDGWPDLVVTGVGINQLRINRGDGTFQSSDLDAQSNAQLLATSAAIADLDGDQIPDLIVANYLNDDRIGEFPILADDGTVAKLHGPLNFQPATETIYTHAADGKIVSQSLQDSGASSSGLGLIVTDILTSPGNEILVGNDARANQLWRRDETFNQSASNHSNDRQWVDVAPTLGIAYGSFGSATASMGIAAADFDRSGTLDFHIANFIKESSNLFLRQPDYFRDYNVASAIESSSNDRLGFGSQAIDYDNNGWSDIVVTNGHVDNLEHRGEPFRQPFQLLTRVAGQYREQPIADPSGYAADLHLGRGLATLDWNVDGQMDLVITDLLDPAALLINETNSPDGDQSGTSNGTQAHWVKLRLIGTVSERDAIGARVEIVCGNQKWHLWQTTGDGYLVKNESLLHCGLGEQTLIDKINIRWPSGISQTISNVNADHVELIVEPNA